MASAQDQLAGFLGKYSPEIERLGGELIAALRQHLPQADVLVYDNYNALAAGFGPDGKTSNAIISIALYPRWASLFFLQAQGLPDPQGLLQGSGKTIRHVRLAGPADLYQPAIAALIEAALNSAKVRLDPARTGELLIKSISANQKPRRPD